MPMSKGSRINSTHAPERYSAIRHLARFSPTPRLCVLHFTVEWAADKIRLAVMDMWKPFRQSTQRNAPQAAILFDKFHILRHLGEALDKIRKAEYGRVTGPQRKFIKGQKYVLLSHKENLTNEGRKGLRLLLKANKRLNTAYILRESFDQLWDYKSEAWARRFFDNWKAQLRWQRLKPYEKFAEMIERHWDGIAALLANTPSKWLSSRSSLRKSRLRTSQPLWARVPASNERGCAWPVERKLSARPSC